MYSIGEIISTYRKKKGLLQQDLADELAKEGIKISYKAISNWERNLAEPSVTIFYKVCRILGITNMYEAYFGVNPADPFSSLTDEGREPHQRDSAGLQRGTVSRPMRGKSYRANLRTIGNHTGRPLSTASVSAKV